MVWQACIISHAPAVLLVRRKLVHLPQKENKSSSLALSTGHLALGLSASSGNAILDEFVQSNTDKKVWEKSERAQGKCDQHKCPVLCPGKPSLPSVTTPTGASWKAHKNLGALKCLPSCVESEGWKVLPDGMHSSPKLQHRSSAILMIWHIPKFPPTKGHSVAVPTELLQAFTVLLKETFCSF